MKQRVFSFGAEHTAPARVLGRCAHCGDPATQTTITPDVVCCTPCWAATLRGEVVRRCPVCGGGDRKHRGCHGCKGRGVVYAPREESDHG